MAWDLIFQGFQDATKIESLRKMFPTNADHIEERNFSRLHKAVLKLEHCNLERYAKTFNSKIDSKDSEGYTALIWAARRNDKDATDVLIKAGADVNLKTYRGVSALHYAAQYSDLGVVEGLLAAGASACSLTVVGYSPLHYASQSKKAKEATVDRLIGAGADLNSKDASGAPPLQISALNNSVDIARGLLKNGADLNYLDDDGDSALMQSIFSKADNVTQLLISQGATYTFWGSNGFSTLHLAALSGGLRTLDILRNAQLHDVDPDALSRDGQTVLQVAQARPSKPEGFIVKLQELLIDIRTRNANSNRAKRNENGTTSKHPKSRYMKRFETFCARMQTRLSHWTQDGRPTITPILRKSLRTWIKTSVLLALAYFGLCYICKALALGWVVRILIRICNVIGPGDFGEL